MELHRLEARLYKALLHKAHSLDPVGKDQHLGRISLPYRRILHHSNGLLITDSIEVMQLQIGCSSGLTQLLWVVLRPGWYKWKLEHLTGIITASFYILIHILFELLYFLFDLLGQIYSQIVKMSQHNRNHPLAAC